MLTNTLLHQLTPWLNAKRWFIGFSGGMDSTVLLHSLVMLKKQYNLPELSAVYIHHGLQQVAEDWPLHCQSVCDELAIPLQIIKVNVIKQASTEEAARKARYQAFESLLTINDVMLTAQHQGDQAETLLFRLMRGAGVRGLGSIPLYRSLGVGRLVRPLLSISYEHLKQYALANNLRWIDDPSNKDTGFTRNYIRHNVVPVLVQKWPSAVNSIAKTASHLQEAQLLLNELALQDLQTAKSEHLYPWLAVPSLLLEPLANLSFARQKNALSYWLSHFTLLPPTQHWRGWQDLLSASENTNPIWKLHQAQLHRANGRIWLLTGDWITQPSLLKYEVNNNKTVLLERNGQVILQGDLSCNSLVISYRQGGERIELAKRGTRDLKRLFNELSVPTFLRNRIPLLLDQQGTLLAVANFPQWRDKTDGLSINFQWLPSNQSLV